MPSTSDLLQLYRIISEAEQKSGRELTNAGRQMLVVPIGELLDAGYTIDWSLLFSTVLQILSAVEPDKYFETRRSNSRSVIGAFASQFCKIPPFCGPVKKER